MNRASILKINLLFFIANFKELLSDKIFLAYSKVQFQY
jgi:hypothetical protein